MIFLSKEINLNEDADARLKQMNKKLGIDKVADPNNDALPDDQSLSAIHQKLGVQDTFGSAMDFVKGSTPITETGQVDWDKVNQKKVKKQENNDSKQKSKEELERRSNSEMKAIKQREAENNQHVVLNNQPKSKNKPKNNNYHKKNNRKRYRKNDNVANKLAENRNNNDNTKFGKNKTVYNKDTERDQYKESSGLTDITKKGNTSKIVGNTKKRNLNKQHPNNDKVKQAPKGYHYVGDKLVKDFDLEQNKENVNILDNINIDLDNIEFVDGDKEDKLDAVVSKSLDNVFDNVPVTETVLNQSGYIANFKSLSFQDITTVLSSQQGTFASEYQLYRIFYNNLVSTNIANKLSFEDFLDITATTDTESIEYGIFSSTFPEETTFDLKCTDCHKKIERYPISNTNLLIIDRTDSIEQREKIIHGISNAESLSQNSLIDKTKRIVLPESKIVVDIQTPTLHDHLDILGTVENKIDNPFAFELVPYIRSISTPDIESYKATHKLRYIKSDDYNNIYKLAGHLRSNDAIILSNAINDYSLKYSVTYGIKEVVCPHCGYINHNVSIDMDDLLFHVALLGLKKIQ